MLIAKTGQEQSSISTVSKEPGIFRNVRINFSFRLLSLFITQPSFMWSFIIIGPSSHACGGPTCLQSGNWPLCFSRTSHPVCCYWLGATHRCPKVVAQKCPNHSKIRKSKQRAGSLQIQTLPYTFSGS